MHCAASLVVAVAALVVTDEAAAQGMGTAGTAKSFDAVGGGPASAMSFASSGGCALRFYPPGSGPGGQNASTDFQDYSASKLFQRLEGMEGSIWGQNIWAAQRGRKNAGGRPVTAAPVANSAIVAPAAQAIGGSPTVARNGNLNAKFVGVGTTANFAATRPPSGSRYAAPTPATADKGSASIIWPTKRLPVATPTAAGSTAKFTASTPAAHSPWLLPASTSGTTPPSTTPPSTTPPSTTPPSTTVSVGSSVRPPAATVIEQRLQTGASKGSPTQGESLVSRLPGSSRQRSNSRWWM